jgi:hypothetical protein
MHDQILLGMRTGAQETKTEAEQRNFLAFFHRKSFTLTTSASKHRARLRLCMG